MAAQYAHDIIGWALSRVGYKEEPIGSNHAPWMVRDLAVVGHKPGDKWCLQFAMAAWYWGCLKNHQTVKWIDLSGNCAEFYDVHRRLGHTFEDISLGAICVLLDKGGRPFHAGVCVAHDYLSGFCWLVEGNGSEETGSSAFAVVLKRREVKDLRFIVPSTFEGVQVTRSDGSQISTK